jgi:hypothetical protein
LAGARAVVVPKATSVASPGERLAGGDAEGEAHPGVGRRDVGELPAALRPAVAGGGHRAPVDRRAPHGAGEQAHAEGGGAGRDGDTKR